jgi:transcriptional regulator with XRE-family HTH domain
LSNISSQQEAPVGQNKRPIPAKLGRKLRAIRKHLDLTGVELIKRLDCPSIPLNSSSINKYEKNLRDPSSIVLLHYARLVKIPVDVLIDDELDLPFK